MTKTTTKLDYHLPKTPMLMPTNEIVGVYMMSMFGSEVVQDYITSPQKICETFGMDISADINFHIVQNTEGEVHLALPYYESFDEVHVVPIEDEEMKEITGGEFFFFILPGILIGIKVASIVGATTATVAVAGSVFTVSTVVGASTGALIAGGVIGGAVGAGVAAGVAGIAVGAAASQEALPVQNK